MTIGIIAAMSPERVIGIDGTLPWHYPADLKRFKRVTTGTTIIMGRLTWESLPRKPLPARRNMVVTSKPEVLLEQGAECFSSIDEALAAAKGDVWFIGGARIFSEAMGCANVIDMTVVPDTVAVPTPQTAIVYFPHIDDTVWQAPDFVEHDDDPRLRHGLFRRREFT